MFVADYPWGLLPRPCRVLVLLNPRGGKGKALQLFQRHVQPLLEEAEISFKLILTGEYRPQRVKGAFHARKPALRTSTLSPERQNHARELVCAEELGRWDALAVMSGDGLMHEVRNALKDVPESLGWFFWTEMLCFNRW